MIAARGDPFADRPFHRVEQIVVHFCRVFPVARVDESLPEAGRSAIVDRKHGIAAVREPLVIAPVAVFVAAPGTAVNQKHGRQIPGGNPHRNCQVTVNGQPIPCLVRDGLHSRQRQSLQFRLITE